MFQNNVGLQKLSIRKHKLRDDGIYIIMEHLLENNTLKVLDLNSNEISFKGCEAIAKYMKGENCSLESLHLANNKCSDYGAKAIAQALAVNKSMIHFRCCGFPAFNVSVYNRFPTGTLVSRYENLFVPIDRKKDLSTKKVSMGP